MQAQNLSLDTHSATEVQSKVKTFFLKVAVLNIKLRECSILHHARSYVVLAHILAPGVRSHHFFTERSHVLYFFFGNGA